MQKKETPFRDLINSLAQGGNYFRIGVPEKFLEAWETKFQTSVEGKVVYDNAFSFITHLDDIRLHGMDKVFCLLVGGDDLTGNTAVKQFKNKALVPGGIPIIFIPSDKAYQQSAVIFPKNRCVVLCREEIVFLFEGKDHKIKLKKHLLDQIPIRRLIPYNTTLPVSGNMFYGREHELCRLIDEGDKSFAIVGPGRIGKSSLLSFYKKKLRQLKLSRLHGLYEIDCYDYSGSSDDDLARFYAMKINPSKRSADIKMEGLINFLKYQKTKQGLPIELLLDEVDEVCTTDTFKMLGEAAKLNLCRLIFCGRSELFKMALDRQSPLDCRMNFLMLKPFEEAIARKLITEPLADLGFSIPEGDKMISDIMKLTGRLPHLLQYVGSKLAHRAIEQKPDTITSDYLEDLKKDYDIAQIFINPLLDLPDDTLQIAIAIMEINYHGKLKASSIKSIAADKGLNFDPKQIMAICNDLVVNNVLTWDNGVFNLTNEALPEYARLFGFLDEE